MPAPAAAFVALLLAVFLAVALPAHSLRAEMSPAKSRGTQIQQVVSPGGITAWLVEEKSIPLISVHLAFLGGSVQDPAGKEGLANMLSALLDEGAGELDSQAFQTRLQDQAIQLSFSAGRDAFYGQLKTLSRNRDDAFDLLRLALNEPRFDAAPVERIRAQILTQMRFEETDPDDIAGKLWFRTAFKGHPYARPVKGSPDSVKSITPEDLRAAAARLFARGNLKIHLNYIAYLAARRNWLAGEHFSYADLAAGAMLSAIDYLGEVPWDQEPAVKEWYQRIKSRPAFRPLLADSIKTIPPVSHYVDLDF
jgi:zinc protease